MLTDDGIKHPCPICLGTEDGACVGGKLPAQCFACGQMCCGGCTTNVAATRKCPTCRAPFHVSDEEKFERLWKLVHDRSPGRHTPVVQFNRGIIGIMYHEGEGVKQDDAEAVTWYRLAAEQGYAKAQSNLGSQCREGKGVKQDDKEAVAWYRKPAEQVQRRS